MKKTIAILTASAMVCSLLSVTAYAANESENIDLAETEDGVLYIEEAGTYTLTGKMNGTVCVDPGEGEVTLILDGADINGGVETALEAVSGDALHIELADGSVNRVIGAGTDCEYSGAVYSTIDASFDGSGTLYVASSGQNGICSENADLVFEDGNYTIGAAKYGVAAIGNNAGSITINGGIFNIEAAGTFTSSASVINNGGTIIDLTKVSNDSNGQTSSDAAKSADNSQTTDSTQVTDQSQTTDSTQVTDQSQTTDSTEVTEESQTTDSTQVTEESQTTDSTQVTDQSQTTDSTQAADQSQTGNITPPADQGQTGNITPPADQGQTGNITPPADQGQTGNITPPADQGQAGNITPPADQGQAGNITPPTDPNQPVEGNNIDSADSATEVVTGTSTNSAADLEADLDNATYITITDENSEITISASGTYVVTGTCGDGNITVKKGTTGVVLILENLDLTSTTGATVSVNKNAEVQVIISGTVVLTDNENPDDEYSEDEDVADAYDGAALKVKADSDAYITGDGTLIINGNAKNGIKGGDDSTIIFDEVTVNITAVNDAINTNYDVTLLSGNFTISAGDDAIHADHIVTIGSEDGTGPVINVTDSYEGIEGTVVNIYGGDISIIAEDDGVNAANSDGLYEDELDYSINIMGGKILVDCDGDGLDSNGNINLIDGSASINSASNGGEAGIDYDGQIYMSDDFDLNNNSGVSGPDNMNQDNQNGAQEDMNQGNPDGINQNGMNQGNQDGMNQGGMNQGGQNSRPDGMNQNGQNNQNQGSPQNDFQSAD